LPMIVMGLVAEQRDDETRAFKWKVQESR
jgi:hypothetical protein